MATFEIDIEGVDKTLNEIKRDLHRGMEKSVDNLVKNAKNKARQVISEEGAVFNYEVYEGFRDEETENNAFTVRAKVYNNVEHAEVLEEGATFPAKGPPVEALLPWVARKMDWNPDGDLHLGDDGIPPSFDGDDGDDDDDDDGGDKGGTSTTSGTKNEYETFQIALHGENEIDLDDVFGTNDIYLSDRRGLFENYRNEYGQDAISLYDSIQDWKSGGSKDLVNTQTYSTILKAAFDIDADIRGGKTTTNFSMEEVYLAESLNEVSKEFLNRHYDISDDGKLSAYRTLRYESPTLSREIWENPDQDSWQIATNAVNNYTTTQSNLEGFDRSLLHKAELDVDRQVLIAIDALIHSDWEREGEIHVKGDYNFEFRADQLEFQSKTYSDSVDFLTDQFFERGSFKSFTDDQLLAIGSTVREMGRERTAVRTDEAIDRINGFIDEFRDRGLYSDTEFSEDKWVNWEAIVTGQGEILEFDDVSRSYGEGWNTYDPTQVETVPLNDTYRGQNVELINIKTDEFIEGEILSRDKKKDSYVVEIRKDEKIQVSKPSDPNSDPYKIVAGLGFENLNRDDQIKLTKEEIDQIEFDDQINDNRISSIKSDLSTHYLGSFKDIQLAHNILHLSRFVEGYNDPDDSTVASHNQLLSGIHRTTISTEATTSDFTHEGFHGVHKDLGYNTNKYPSNDDSAWNNLWRADGTNYTNNGDWNIGEVLLQKDGEDPIGLPDDGSIPQVLRDRVNSVDSNYIFKGVDDEAALLHPSEGELSVGDRVKINGMWSVGDETDEAKVTDIGLFEEDESNTDEILTEYKLETIKDQTTLRVWVNDQGGYELMQGVSIEEYAPQPDEMVDASKPEVVLEKNGMDRVIEAVNLAYMEQAWHFSTSDRDVDRRIEKIPPIGRPYSHRAANEVLTTLTELLRAENPRSDNADWMSEGSIRRVDEHYQYLIEAWLEEFNPSSEVSIILEDLGYNV